MTSNEVPATSKGDAHHAITKAGIGAIPVAGSLLAEAYCWFVKAPVEQRRDEWAQSVGERLQWLEQNRGVDIGSLQKDPAFVDLLLQAQQVAIRNSEADKLDALRAAVENAAIGGGPEQAVRQMFLHRIDVFTVWHVRLLRLFNDPSAFMRKNGKVVEPYAISGSLASLVEQAFPDLRGKRDFYDQIWRDLRVAGLVNTEGLHGMMSSSGVMDQRTTALGSSFVEFIEAPV